MSRPLPRRTAPPDIEPVALGGEPALSVDVEEWYHNCWIPEYVEPTLRPSLAEELDRLLPDLVERLAATRSKATFFVLGEVARRIPSVIRELVDAGHEVACHGELHLRANQRSVSGFRADVDTAKKRLEDLVGAPVEGFRAPEWSLRSPENPRLRSIAELGFRYDSSLVPALGAGSRSNPATPVRLSWPDGFALVELPPLTWRCGIRLPASGWTGRLAPPGLFAHWVASAARRGEMPLLAVHPWEVVARPCPGVMTGFARLFHDAGRQAFASRFDDLLTRLKPAATLAQRCSEVEIGGLRKARIAATATTTGFELLREKGAP